MAEQYQKLVNKQFNSPINLYSDRNVREIIQKQSRILSNGAVGIDFNDPMVGKPTNLQNSAVLRMLEEEENRKRGGQAGSAKRVAWPPPAENNDFVEQPPVQSQGGPIFPSKSVQSNQTPIQQHPSSSPNYQKAPPPQSPNFQPITVDQPTDPSYQSTPISPGSSKGSLEFGSSAKPWGTSQSPSFNQLHFKSVQAPQTLTKETVHTTKSSSVQEYQITQKYQSPSYSVSESSFQQYYKVEPQTQPATSSQTTTQHQVTRQTSYQATPQSPQQVTRQTSYHSQASPQPDLVQQPSSPQVQSATPYQPTPQSAPVQQPSSPQVQSASPQQFKSFAQPTQSQPTSTPAKPEALPYRSVQLKPATKPVEPPPSTITLRPKAPVSQAPPPVITSQPATATLRGGKNLRGDLKWPPEVVKEKMEAERVHEVELLKGPQFRPPKHLKDYSRFFAQHALNSTYPGYKIPPGTQFYDHNPVM